MLGMPTYLDVEASWATFDTDEYFLFTQGVRTWKLRDDLERYDLAIEASQPEVIIEVGTKWGGSALHWASRGLDVIVVDIDLSLATEAMRLDLDARPTHPIVWIERDSVSPWLVGELIKQIDGRRCMVSLDGEHAAPHVLQEIDMYAPLVSPGCYLVVEDGIFDLVDPKLAHRGGARIPAEGGPLVAIRQSGLPDAAEWHRDIDIEKWTTKSYHPAGFWLRCEEA